MSALSEARKPVLVHPEWKVRDDLEERRLNRNGWIVVLVAALLAAVLFSFARRADPDVLMHLSQSALVD